MDALEDFDDETHEKLESIQWLLLTIDYILETITYAGAIYTFLLTLSLLSAFIKSNQKLSSGYFYLLVIGYFVVILSVVSYVLASYVFTNSIAVTGK